jgi:hypothetical protein
MVSDFACSGWVDIGVPLFHFPGGTVASPGARPRWSALLAVPKMADPRAMG